MFHKIEMISLDIILCILYNIMSSNNNINASNNNMPMRIVLSDEELDRIFQEELEYMRQCAEETRKEEIEQARLEKRADKYWNGRKSRK